MYGYDIDMPAEGYVNSSKGSSDSKCSGSNVVYGPGNCDGYSGGGRTEIQFIQNLLVVLDYLTVKEVTGQYGSKTYAAVQKFQKDYGLSQDGQVGPNTLSLLKEQSDARRTALQLHDQNVAAPKNGAPAGEEGFLTKWKNGPWFWPTISLGSLLLIGGALMLRARK